MQSWQQAVRSGIIPGLIAGFATSATAAVRGRAETGSAVAPINAASHVAWGEDAANVERVTMRHTLFGYLINSGAAIFWATVLELLFGRALERRGLPAALIAGAATASLAYVTDYKLVPKRFTPGYEERVSGRSLFLIYSVLGLALGAGGYLVHARRRRGS